MPWQQWLADEINNKGYTKGAELGVLRGKLSLFLLNSCPDLHLCLVDMWKHCPERENDEGGETYQKHNMEHLFHDLVQQTRPYHHRVEIHRVSTKAAAQIKLYDQFDFVVVDADHRYKGVIEDISHWWPKIRQGGIMVFDDYHWPSVSRAVNDSFSEVEIIEEKGCIARKDHDCI